MALPNIAFEPIAGSHPLAAAAQRGRSADRERSSERSPRLRAKYSSACGGRVMRDVVDEVE